MFTKSDDTYQSLLKDSVNQWLDQMGGHEDIEVRGGVRAVVEHITALNQKINALERSCRTKDDYLRQMKAK